MLSGIEIFIFFVSDHLNCNRQKYGKRYVCYWVASEAMQKQDDDAGSKSVKPESLTTGKIIGWTTHLGFLVCLQLWGGN